MTRFDHQLSAAARQYESAAPEDDARAERRDEIRQELERAWLASPEKLTDAAEEIIYWGYDDMPQDLAAAMQGHPDDQDKRDLAFMRQLRLKVTALIGANARLEADTQEEREWQERNEGRDDAAIYGAVA